MASTNVINSTRIEVLSKDNYDTWKIHVEALLIKNDLWSYVCGEKQKPEPAAIEASQENQIQAQAAIDDWIKMDRKAKSDLLLSINSSEVKQVSACGTSKEVWDKLESIYVSKGPARKATLFKQLMLHRMGEEDDIKDHLAKFLDAVDKLKSMDVTLDSDMLTIMLLYSLPDSFENFRIAVDTLMNVESLKVKIIEETEARRQKSSNNVSGAMLAKNLNVQDNSDSTKQNDKKRNQRSKLKCHYCHIQGHKITECRKKKKAEKQKANLTDENYFVDTRAIETSLLSKNTSTKLY